jgi:hypothetical protein
MQVIEALCSRSRRLTITLHINQIRMFGDCAAQRMLA